MKKVTILGHASARTELTKRLHKQGLLHLISNEEQVVSAGLDERLASLEREIGDANFLLDLLRKHNAAKPGFIRSMMAPRVDLTQAEYDSIREKFNLPELVQRCEALDEELTAARSDSVRLHQERHAQLEWLDLDVPSAPGCCTPHTELIVGELPAKDLPEARADLSVSAPLSEMETVSKDSSLAKIVALVHRSEADEVRQTLAKYAFRPVTVESELDPASQIEHIDREIEALASEEAQALEELEKLTVNLGDVLILRERLQHEHDRLSAELSLARTKQVFMLQGWTTEDDVQAVRRLAADVSSATDMSVSDPEPDEKAPVALKNPKFLKPFEVLVNLYGSPRHTELDPTPWMAPFFFIFFGICLGDFGYGLVLALVCWWAIGHYGLRDNARLFMHLMIYGGVGSMIAGVLTGGYFGVEMVYLPGPLKAMVLLDPLMGAVTFMIVSIALGVIQVTLGVILEGVDAARNGDWETALLDQATTVAFVVTAVIGVVCWITITTGGKPSPTITALYPVGTTGLAIAAFVLVLLQGRVHRGFATAWSALTGKTGETGETPGDAEGQSGLDANETARAAARRAADEEDEKPVRPRGRVVLDAVLGLALLVAIYAWAASFFVAPQAVSLVGKVLLGLAIAGLALSPFARRAIVSVLAGLYNLYGMSGFIGDFLSYARLMAIGLATVLVGITINKLFMEAAKAGPIGFILGLGILLFGHPLNLIINLLGAFVHPLRLQFVEFFGKFYEDGGERFKPFAQKSKHLVFSNESGSSGGADAGSEAVA